MAASAGIIRLNYLKDICSRILLYCCLHLTDGNSRGGDVNVYIGVKANVNLR